MCTCFCLLARRVDVRLSEKGNSNSYGARPVHLVILMMKWIWTSRVSIKNSPSLSPYEAQAFTKVKPGTPERVQGVFACKIQDKKLLPDKKPKPPPDEKPPPLSILQ